LLWRFLWNFIKHFQLFYAFSIHLFLGFRVYPQMRSIEPIIHYFSCCTWFLVSICAFVSFTFPPSLYLYDLVSLILLANFYLCVFLSCIFVFIFISFQTPSLFSSISLPISMYLAFSNFISINSYFCPYVCLFILVFLFWSLHVALCVIVSSIFNHSFSLCVY
jgi:hypothetical protein